MSQSTSSNESSSSVSTSNQDTSVHKHLDTLEHREKLNIFLSSQINRNGSDILAWLSNDQERKINEDTKSR